MTDTVPLFINNRDKILSIPHYLYDDFRMLQHINRLFCCLGGDFMTLDEFVKRETFVDDSNIRKVVQYEQSGYTIEDIYIE